MDLKEPEKLTKGKLGMRFKQKDDGILIYTNAWTLIIDMCKLVKLKLNNFICL